jgi:carbonic anhydrase/acetyltransferase-like protein (isoleucine patch superfamily)
MAVHSLDGISPTLPADGRYWIAPTATVIGKVTLGEGVGIWFGAVLRGDGEAITVGADSNLQEHAVVHTDPGYPATIGIGCTIGHRAIIHGCTIGNNVLIGMGAIILNGAVIGDNSLVGAGALVTEGKVIPPGSLVIGSPAKVARQLDDAAIERLRKSAAHYAANWRRFAKGLDR